MANQKAVDQFETTMSKSGAINKGLWRVSTSKRITVTPPEGVMLFDEDEGKYYVGDGSTNGGVAVQSVKKVRKVEVAAAATGMTDSGTDYSLFTWASAAGLRTGDSITLAAGGGTAPSGAAGAITGEVWIKKANDEGTGDANTGTTFNIASGRDAAIAGNTTTVLMSGVNFTSVYTSVGVQGDEDVVLFEPLGASVQCVLPDADSSDGFSTIVKKDSGGSTNVYFKELDNSGNVDGDANIDEGAIIALVSGAADYVSLVCDGDAYWSVGSRISGS